MRPLGYVLFASLLALAVALTLAGCSTGKPRIRAANTQLVGTLGQDQPATLNTSTETTQLPTGTTIETRTDGSRIVTLAAPTILRAETVAANTGGTSREVAKHRIDSDRRAGLARVQMIVGVALIVGGLLVGFALPAWMRWQQVGVYVAGAGLVLVLLRDPPTWMIAALIAGAVACVLAYYSTRAKSPFAPTK